MNSKIKKDIKNSFKKYSIQPIKRLGQNFLIDKLALKKVVEAADIQPSDIILEIGSGTGILTLELAKKAKKVIAIEKDPQMIEVLKETLKDFNNVKIIYGDVLKIENLKLEAMKTSSSSSRFANARVIEDSFKVVANLPYYITSPIIKKFLENKNPPNMTLMVQKEVGRRICAKPGQMNLLAVSVQFYAEPKIVSYISKKSFWPQPKVDSAIIKITPRLPKKGQKANLDKLFFKIVKAGFSQPRKQLINNLSKKLNIDKLKIREWLLKNNIQPSQRAETLSVIDWLNLASSVIQ